MQKAALTGHDLILWLVQILKQTPPKENAVANWQKDAEAYLQQRASAGANLIEQERLEQLEKHGITLLDDRKHTAGQLWNAAMFCVTGTSTWWPDGWDLGVRNNIGRKEFKERLVIAGALLAAEIDRLLEYEQPGGTYTSTTPAELVVKEAIAGQVFEATLVQLAGTNDFWAGALELYRTGVRPKPTAAQRLGEVIATKMADLPAVDGMDIELLAQAAVDGIGNYLANYCDGNCGDNYCDENGCVKRKRVLVDDLLPAPAVATSAVEEVPEVQEPAKVDGDATLRTPGDRAGKK